MTHLPNRLLLSKLTAFLLSPAPSIHPPIPMHTPTQWLVPRSPRAQQEACKILYPLPAVAPLDKGPHLKGDVRSKVVAMVNVPCIKQQRKRAPESPLCSPCQNLHCSGKKMPYHLIQIVNFHMRKQGSEDLSCSNCYGTGGDRVDGGNQPSPSRPPPLSQRAAYHRSFPWACDTTTRGHVHSEPLLRPESPLHTQKQKGLQRF